MLKANRCLHIELFHWGSGYTSIRLLTEFAQFAKEKGERDPPQKPARGGLVLPFRTVKWQETQDSSQRSVEPPPPAAATRSVGSFLHLSQWKAKRAQTWKQPRYSPKPYGKPPFLMRNMTHMIMIYNILILCEDRVVGTRARTLLCNWACGNCSPHHMAGSISGVSKQVQEAQAAHACVAFGGSVPPHFLDVR